MNRVPATVFDLLRNALPVGTRITAGHAGLQRPVTWTSVLHARPPAFESLEGREMAILSIDALRQLSDKLTLADIVHDLAQMDVAAIAVIGGADSRARAAADDHGIPLLHLPDGLSMRQVERDVVRTLVGPLPAPEVRGQEVYAQLLQLTTENRGMKAVIEALADLTGRSVVAQDKRLDVVAAAGELTAEENWQAVQAALGSEDPLPSLFRNRVEVAQLAPEPVELDMPDLGVRRLVMPIVANRMGRGFFSLLAAYERGARRFRRPGPAVRETRRGSLRSRDGQRESGARGAEADAGRRHRATAARVAAGGPGAATPGAARPPARRAPVRHRRGDHARAGPLRAAAGNDAERADSRARPGSAGTDDRRQRDRLLRAGKRRSERGSQSTLPRHIRQFAETSLARLRSAERSGLAAIGVGRPVDSLPEWRTSYLEALAALNTAVQWGVEQPLYFANLGVYQLLSLLMQTPELRKFYRDTLGGLAEENTVNSEFVATLEMFFEEHGNLSKTASRLHVHRNTLLYRMERIAQIGNFDLEDPKRGWR